MIAALVVMVLAQPARLLYLPADQALERVFPDSWGEVVKAPQTVTLEGLVPVKKGSHEVKVRWRRALAEDPESVTALQRLLLAGESYSIPGPGFGSLKLCGRPTPNVRVTFTSAKRVVIADICFGCGSMWLRFDENGRRVRDDIIDLARHGWVEAFAPLVPEDDYVAQRKRRQDEIDERTRSRALDGGVP